MINVETRAGAQCDKLFARPGVLHENFLAFANSEPDIGCTWMFACRMSN